MKFLEIQFHPNNHNSPNSHTKFVNSFTNRSFKEFPHSIQSFSGLFQSSRRTPIVTLDQVWNFYHLMEPSVEEVYAAFEKKVKKTIYVDNLSQHVTKAVLETAFNQFGTVANVQFIPTHFTSCSVNAALVEMQSVKQAEEIVREMGDSPFMISGMPRPVRAQKAQMEMFDDRPKKRQRKIVCSWIDPSHPNFEVGKRLKYLTKKHAAEASFLMEQQLADEEKLHNQQSESLKTNYKKYELIDGAQSDGIVKRLAARYETKVHEF